jgi:lipid II:glycine glycyltransferase (peptidoglycan interpeptide bridge formation enzyme)
MKMLSEFVSDFEEFMIWIKQQPAESEESIRRFEKIFSVTEQTHLLRNIQDIKDELCMLKAVFDDQVQVLLAAGEEIEQANFQCIHGCEVSLAIQQNLRCPHSSKAFVDQSSKHLKQIERMQAQASQAYDTVSLLIVADFAHIWLAGPLNFYQLKDLLNLKQQQANVLEARVSRNQAISSGEQSKTILVFTIVTIVFVCSPRPHSNSTFPYPYGISNSQFGGTAHL